MSASISIRPDSQVVLNSCLFYAKLDDLRTGLNLLSNTMLDDVYGEQSLDRSLGK